MIYSYLHLHLQITLAFVFCLCNLAAKMSTQSYAFNNNAYFLFYCFYTDELNIYMTSDTTCLNRPNW